MVRAKENILIKIKFFSELSYILSLLRKSEAWKLWGTSLGYYVVGGGKNGILTYKRWEWC